MNFNILFPEKKQYERIDEINLSPCEFLTEIIFNLRKVTEPSEVLPSKKNFFLYTLVDVKKRNLIVVEAMRKANIPITELAESSLKAFGMSLNKWQIE